MKRVSVIIPFYSNIEWLYEAIESVIAQTYTDYEIIIVNDGSKEDLTDFIIKYGTKIKYIYKENEGPGSARNLGIDLANGKYIAFLDSDDIWFKEKLARQVDFMDKTNAVWSHTNWIQFSDNQPNKILKYYNSGIAGEIFPLSLVSINIATPTVMIRSDILKSRQDLRFNEQMRFGQDYFLWILLSAEFPLYLLPEVLCRVRVRGTNTSLRARAHIQVRTQIWQSLKNQPSKLFYKQAWFFIIRTLYYLCSFGYSLVLMIEKKYGVRPRVSEVLSKIIFFPLYLSFRLIRLVIRIKPIPDKFYGINVK